MESPLTEEVDGDEGCCDQEEAGSDDAEVDADEEDDADDGSTMNDDVVDEDEDCQKRKGSMRRDSFRQASERAPPGFLVDEQRTGRYR